MMKNVTAAIVLCLMSASAFAAAPAFDSPEQEAAHYPQERAGRLLKNDTTTRRLRKMRRITPCRPLTRRSRKRPITSRNGQDRPLKNDMIITPLRKARCITLCRPLICRNRKRPIMTGWPNGKPLKRCSISPAIINWRHADGTLPACCKNACAVFLFI